MKAKIVYCALVLVPALILAACATNAPGPADRCRPVFDRTYWTEYKGGGTDAAAWAYLRASEAAEACQRGK